jgi:type I restriction enzyme S subunit
MAGNGTLRDLLEGLRDLCSAEIWKMEMSKVNEPPRRFEAGFFASEGYVAVDAMHHSGFELSTVGKHSRVKWFGPFARKYVTDRNHGCPFLTSSTMMEARPRTDKLVSIKHTHHLEALKVYEDDILISCSGTIGNVVLCTKDVDGWACSQDAIRVTVHEPDHLGLVYCFLQSPLGQFLLKKKQTGSVVRHIYEADVSTLPIPRLPRALREELTRLVKQASALRVEANRLLDEAEEMVYKQNYIDGPVPTIPEEVESTSVGKSRLSVSYNGVAYHRLEATFHRPVHQQVRDMVMRCRNVKPLREVVASVPYTGPGSVPGVNKVDPEFGRPAITGQGLRKTRPVPAYHVASRKERLVLDMMPPPGTTLVMCAGTLGATDYVGPLYEGWAVSLDVIRVIPDPAKLHSGYVHAFLNTELGQLQMTQHRYGSVIPRIHSRQVAEILVPVPQDKGALIGDMTDKAFSNRTEAYSVENVAINLFMTAVKQGRKTIESEWGDQY